MVTKITAVEDTTLIYGVKKRGEFIFQCSEGGQKIFSKEVFEGMKDGFIKIGFLFNIKYINPDHILAINNIRKHGEIIVTGNIRFRVSEDDFPMVKSKYLHFIVDLP